MFNAATHAPNGKIYFFDAGLYWRSTWKNGTATVDPGYPKLIEDFWPGVPTNIDAAWYSNWYKSKKIYFMKGENYWRYDFDKGRVDDGYPRKISKMLLGGWDHDIQSAVAVGRELWLFRRDRIQRFSLKSHRLLAENNLQDRFEDWSVNPDELCCVFNGMGDERQMLYAMAYPYQDRLVGSVNPSDHTSVHPIDSKNREALESFPLNDVGKGWTGFRNRIPENFELTINNFSARSDRGRFPEIRRSEIAAGLREAITHPRGIMQTGSNLCGPIAIIAHLLQTKPQNYLQFVIDLYERGSFQARDDRFVVSEGFRTLGVGERGITASNWLLAAGMKDHWNGPWRKFENDDSASEALVAGTSGPAMRYFVEQVLDFEDADLDRTYVRGEHTALLSAETARRKGGPAFLMVQTLMFTNGSKSNKEAKKSASSSVTPNHWILYEGQMHHQPGKWWVHDDDQYEFDLWSWGRRYRVDTDEGRFEDTMYGVVFADLR